MKRNFIQRLKGIWQGSPECDPADAYTYRHTWHPLHGIPVLSFFLAIHCLYVLLVKETSDWDTISYSSASYTILVVIILYFVWFFYHAISAELNQTSIKNDRKDLIIISRYAVVTRLLCVVVTFTATLLYYYHLGKVPLVPLIGLVVAMIDLYDFSRRMVN